VTYSKLEALLHSRKFWSLITSLVGLGVAVAYHALPPDQAIPLAVAALAAYSVGVGLDSPATVIPTAGSTTNVAGPTTVVQTPLVDGHEIPHR